MLTTLRQMFTNTFNKRDVLQWAKEVGALQRLRDIHPADLALATTHCAMGDETRSIATARRVFFTNTGYMPQESSFYDRFTEGSVALMRRLFERALSASTRERRAALAAALKGSGLVDVEAIDGSQITLPASAAEVYPSTSPDHGGVKLTAALSVLYQTITAITVTDAKTHDRKALTLPRWLHDRLLLIDRGYADHRLWATIADRKGFFLTPLKSTTMPMITAIRSGVGKAHVGEVLSGDLRYWQTVDVDAEFKVRKRGRRTFRVVRVVVCVDSPDGGWEQTDLWFVTNLPPEQFSPEQIATIYRFRWEVEQLFRTLKMVGRLDHLRSSNPHVIHTFIYATLLGMVLAHDLCAVMRRTRPDTEPSQYRVASLLLLFLPSIVSSLGTRRQSAVLRAFEAALWREGVNPNPGRPYRSTAYARQLCYAA
ncbi:MAG: IS4 family transposase [Actinomycetota bacterium]|nr:IS4 family transposase [Actinomycetota bacterium]